MSMSEGKAWRCTVCGYIHYGDEPPDECPVCGAPALEFEPVEAEVERDVVSETFDVLRSLGHGEADARHLLDGALSKKKKYSNVEALLQAVYQQKQEK